MADRHKHDGISYRPPEGVRAWLRDRKERTGRPVNASITEAIDAYRQALCEACERDLCELGPVPAPAAGCPHACHRQETTVPR